MVDLRSQYERIRGEVDRGIEETIRDSAFINGPAVKAFEKELADYLNCRHVIPCANGTDALQICMMALGLQPGDEVITANFTFIATVEVLALLQLTPVLVDVEPNTFNLDPEAVRKAITKKTRAIVPVHLFGQPADMDDIMSIADQHGLYVIEDNAQAIGASYRCSDGLSKKAGTIGHMGTTSFFPSKNLGCYGDGGAIFTDDNKLAEKTRMIINHGSKVKYYHEEVGVNSRLDTLQAAILRAKLPHLDEYITARQQAADYYDAGLSGQKEIQTPVRQPNRDHVFHQYTLRIKNGMRDQIRAGLAKADIPSMIYYPVPLSLQLAFEHLGYRKGDFPVTEQLCQEVLSLPMHTELTLEQQEYIITHLIKLF